MPPKESICQEADRIVSNDRNQDYGHPLPDFERVADLWHAQFGWEVTPEDVGIAMILMKTARQQVRAKRDNLVDIAGYAKTLEMIADVRRSNTHGHTPPLFVPPGAPGTPEE